MGILTIRTTLSVPHPLILGIIYLLSEVFLAVTRRSGSGATSHDRRSLLLLWGVISVSIWLGISVSVVHGATLPHLHLCYLVGLLLFIAGVVLRWYSIVYLGRFFTVDVAIAHEHELIDSGPYRFIRHPSYTGALIAFVGFGLCLGSWLALACMVLPITAAFLWRIHVEEQALADALGDKYRIYMRRTKRLIPFVY